MRVRKGRLYRNARGGAVGPIDERWPSLATTSSSSYPYRCGGMNYTAFGAAESTLRELDLVQEITPAEITLQEGGVYLDHRGFHVGPLVKSSSENHFYSLMCKKTQWHFNQNGRSYPDMLSVRDIASVVSEPICDPVLEPAYLGEWEDV